MAYGQKISPSAEDIATFIEQTAKEPEPETPIKEAEMLVLDLKNFVTDVFEVIEKTKVEAPAPPSVSALQKKRQALIDDGHPLTPEGFLNAAKTGNRQLILRYLDAGMNVNVRSAAHQTALHFAVVGEQLDMVQMLLTYGAKPNSRNTRGDTPLHLAVTQQDPYATALLLHNGAQPNLANRQGWTSLHLAATDGAAEIFALLEDKGGDINRQTRVGMTPLMLTLWKGHTRLAMYLLGIEAQTTQTDPHGNDAFLLAIIHNQPKIVDIFLRRGADPNAINKRGWSALDIALNDQNFTIANLLYAAGAKTPGLERTPGALLNPNPR